MKFNKKMLLASTLALSVFASFNAQAQAEEQVGNWAARSVEEVQTDLVNQDNNSTYTVKYGDTLGTIAEAMSIDVNVLAKVNQIADINVIFPDTVITATYDAQHNATGLTIEGANTDQSASVDFSTNEVTVGDTTTSLDDIEAPASSEVPAASSEAAVAQPEVAPSEQAQTSETAVEAPATSEVASAPAVDTAADANAQVDATAVAEQASTAEVAPASETETSEAETTVSDLTAQSEAPVTEEQVAEQNPAPAEVQATGAGADVNTDGLQPNAAAYATDIANQYGVTDIGTVREGDSGDHGSGKAVDVMVPQGSDLGDQVAADAAAKATSGEYGISYVIWEQQFYAPTDNIYGPANQWNPMPDRGDATANHYDHVHVSFN
ncbi:LysM peptidoglycan-binding domain-containing protein [Streptococcus dentapri]|uniref:LysM peptidoglycan-binding domain-containing protein n=1 Tax=Streptococcus dentapri TaxID=573564 RepID=A0ABV8D383_9STRE